MKAEQPVQTSKDELPTVRREPWEPVLAQEVYTDADSGDRIRPARFFTGQMPVGEQVRGNQAQVSVVRPTWDPMKEKGRE